MDMFRELFRAFLVLARHAFGGRAKLVAENALLRQQVIVLQRGTPCPRLEARDRWGMVVVTKIFPALLDAANILRPGTVIRWHRSLWRLLWRRRSQRPVGCPPIDADTRALIRRMWKENPLWGENVIAAELAKLGHHVSPRTVAKWSQTPLSPTGWNCRGGPPVLARWPVIDGESWSRMRSWQRTALANRDVRLAAWVGG